MQTTSPNTDRTGKDDVGAERKKYTPPMLVTYGSVKNLTLGTGVTANGDGGQMMML